MDNGTFERIIAEHGLAVSYKDYINRGGNGRSATYVYVKQGRTVRSLGKSEQVEAMTEEELRQVIAAKFPAKEGIAQ